MVYFLSGAPSTGHTASEVFELDKARRPLPRLALPVSVRATARMSNTPIASSNVIAKLEGSDPRLRSEHVVLSAHLDAQAALEHYRKSLYHTPSDDVQQPVNLETLAKFELVARAMLLDIANNPRRPEWKPRSLYKRYAK